MANWKEHGKDLLKAAGISTVAILAWEYNSEVRDYLVCAAKNPDLVYDWRVLAPGLETLARSSKYLLLPLAPFLTYEILKNR